VQCVLFVGQFRQGGGVVDSVGAGFEHHGVAGQFPVVRESTCEPVNHRVVIKQGQHRQFGKIEQVVQAPDMRQLVQQNRDHLLTRQPQHHADRQQDHRPQPAKQHGRIDIGRLTRLDATTYAHAQ